MNKVEVIFSEIFIMIYEYNLVNLSVVELMSSNQLQHTDNVIGRHI